MALKRKRRVNEGMGPGGGGDTDSHSEGAKTSEKEHLSRPRTLKAGWIHSESIFWEQIPKVLPADPFPAEQDVQCHIP